MGEGTRVSVIHVCHEPGKQRDFVFVFTPQVVEQHHLCPAAGLQFLRNQDLPRAAFHCQVLSEWDKKVMGCGLSESVIVGILIIKVLVNVCEFVAINRHILCS